MNDPGFDEAIAETANDAENRKQDGSSLRSFDRHDPDTSLHWVSADRELSHYLQPARWWYASTEIPLIAATFGPMANAFSVCSLSQHWREIVKPGGPPIDQAETLPDPPTIIALNAVSLVAALIANFCLLMTMTQRMSFSIAQPIVIVGWYISSILLTIILIIAARDVASQSQTAPGLQMTEGYYYGAIAAGLYFLLSTFLLFTVYGAFKGHYSKQFHLTKSQRTLMIQTTAFFVYLLAGSAVYSKIEGWRFTDAVWWSDFTILTIGIGYPAPKTHLGRGLLFPYAFGGILIVGIVISSIRSLVMERGKTKMSRRLIEKSRQVGVKKLAAKYGNFNSQSAKGGFARFFFKKSVPDDQRQEKPDEMELRRREFFAMRHVREIANLQHRWLSLLSSTIAVALLWCIGALIFEHAEAYQEWTYFDGMYYAYTSLLTIGYGDIYNITNWGRVFFVFWSLLAVPTMTIFISNMGNTVIRAFRDFVDYLGELTILPGEMGYRARIKQVYERAKAILLLSDEKGPERTSKEKPSDENGEQNQSISRAEEALEEEQLREEQEAREHGDVLAENIHHHQFLLIKELRQMFKYINMTPPKEFEYEEWVYFLKLLGEEEAHDKSHRKPYIDASEGGKEEDRGKWSWIGHRSPLLGDKQEAEWLLEALADKLERGLRQLSDEYRRRNSERCEDANDNVEDR
ncbi:putative potassium channel [Talaromyces proteolyticus]|uniref:Potassium channel n=1 Tax=Talaromyces proteolyticus TaxID=1131652 RepID=A0AAD4L3G4_9EURO|nr:putative potassium channel [Talaromyces proteolyticus]KAH8703513.1 putative potassium channel [Talaromyces proteolyticus]